MTLWAAAIAAGISDELYWTLTVTEVSAVLKREAAKARAADMRAGLIAAMLYNVHRKKGSRALGPEDFIKGPGADQYMTPAEGRRALTAWAGGINRGFKEPREDDA